MASYINWLRPGMEGQAAKRRHGQEDVSSYLVTGRVDMVENPGNEQMLYGVLGDKQVLARVDARTPLHPGDDVQLYFDMQRIHIFDAETECCIISRLAEPASSG